MNVTSAQLHNIIARRLGKNDWGDKYLTQEELDLSSSRQPNRFPYKGQFSPDFVANLLKYYSTKNSVVFDPFTGSGTVLFEAAKMGLTAYGTEINPAAYEMASTIRFISVNRERRNDIVQKILQKGRDLPKDLDEQLLHKQIEHMIGSTRCEFEENILKNAYIRFLRSGGQKTAALFVSFVKKHAEIVLSLPFSNNREVSKVFLTDARTVPLSRHSVDLVITSPPYINVFNYHEHNRAFIDRIYGGALQVARSEFGANRKHRQNRFLTVTQYMLDMTQTLENMHTLLKPGGRLIIVVGKSSKVRGVSFRNDYITAGVAAIAGYTVVAKQERKFKNQFGETIFEEILHLFPFERQSKTNTIELARNFSIEVLKKALTDAVGEIRDDIEQASQNACNVKPSPLFSGI